ncbi:MAG TPA: hypothetical protein VNQ90_18135 [Chthoniobacteraceae bacterium]|nr:hypothetical protein [Chthoniobacteraceae bacterium]
MMKALMMTGCAAVLLAGCASYDSETTVGIEQSRDDIYRDSWLTGNEPGRYSQTVEGLRSRQRVWREPEQVEITRTQQAMALRKVALQRQEKTSSFESSVLGSGSIPQPSGSVSTSFPVDEEGRTLSTPNQQIIGTASTAGRLPAVAEGPRVNNTPIASPVAARPGYVISPYAPGSGYVDVTGIPAGSNVRDPYSGKIFRVP